MAPTPRTLLLLTIVSVLLSAPLVAVAQSPTSAGVAPSGAAADPAEGPMDQTIQTLLRTPLEEPILLQEAPTTGSRLADPDYPDGYVEFAAGGELIDAPYHLIVPRDSDLERAEVTLTGMGVPGDTLDKVYDLSGGTHEGFAGSSTNSPPSGPPSNFEQAAFSAADEATMEAEDGTSKTNSYNNGQNPYHHFSFSIQKGPIGTLSVGWKGSGVHSENHGGNQPSTCKVYLYDEAGEEWEFLTETSAGANTRVDWVTLEDPDRFVTTDARIHVMVMGEKGSGWGSQTGALTTDYVMVQSVTSVWFVTDASLDIGGDGGTPDWSHPGVFRGDVELDEPPFKNAIQEALDRETAAATPEQYNVEIEFKFVSLTQGKIALVSWVLQKESPPYIFVPDTYEVLEDIDTPMLINLHLHTQDDGDINSLIYKVVKQEDSSLLRLKVNSDGKSLDVETPKNDWSGQVWFQVEGTDDTLKAAVSNKFFITVLPQNDRPRLINPGLITGIEGSPCCNNGVLTATDPDGDDILFTTDSVLLGGGQRLLPGLTPESRVIQFIPTNEEVGEHAVKIVVSDQLLEKDTRVVIIKIEDLNEPPTFSEEGIDWMLPETLIANEGQLFELDVMAEDVDLINGDQLRYTDDSNAFDIDSKTGRISFTPANEMVGESQVTITVSDARGDQIEQSTTLRVINRNDAPVLAPIPILTALEDEAFEYRVEAYDADFNDQLTFSVKFPGSQVLFEINERTGKIAFTPIQEHVGRHTIDLKVTDKSKALSDTARVTLEVLNVNDPPNPATVVMDPESGVVKAGERLVLTANATDPDLDTLDYSWEDANGINLATGRSYPTSDLPVGTHQITVVVKDPSGGTTEQTVTVKVNPADGTTSRTGSGRSVAGVPFFVLLLLVVAGVVVGGAVVWQRTKPLEEELAEASEVDLTNVPLAPIGAVGGAALDAGPTGPVYIGTADDDLVALPPGGGGAEMPTATVGTAADGGSGGLSGSGPTCPSCGASGMVPLGSAGAMVCPACGHVQEYSAPPAYGYPTSYGPPPSQGPPGYGPPPGPPF